MALVTKSERLRANRVVSRVHFAYCLQTDDNVPVQSCVNIANFEDYSMDGHHPQRTAAIATTSLRSIL